jgi:hypothetical protein
MILNMPLTWPALGPCHFLSSSHRPTPHPAACSRPLGEVLAASTVNGRQDETSAGRLGCATARLGDHMEGPEHIALDGRGP